MHGFLQYHMLSLGPHTVGYPDCGFGSSATFGGHCLELRGECSSIL